MVVEGMTISLTRDSTTFTFSEVGYDTTKRITETLQKEVHKHKGGMGAGKAVVQDHLRNEHIFTLEVVFVSKAGVKTAWQKRREFIQAMQYTGKIWDLKFVYTAEGINETYEVVCEKVIIKDLGARVKEVRATIQLIETKNLEEL